MPSKRPRDIAEILEEEDEKFSDYDDSAPARSKRSKASRSQPRRKRTKRTTRQGYDDSDITNDSSLDDDMSEDDLMNSSSDDEPVQTTSTGRPSRRAAKKATYEESSSANEAELSEVDSDQQHETRSPQKRLLVTLKTRATPTSARNVNSASIKATRTRSGSNAASDQGFGIRRSSRIAHDDASDLFGLTNSGNLGVTRKGTQSPEIASRPQRGGKGIMVSTKSVIEEGEEPSSGVKEEIEESFADNREIMESVQYLIDEGESADTNEQSRHISPEGVDDGHDTTKDMAPDSADEGPDDDSEDPVSKGRRLTRSKTTLQPENGGDESSSRRTRERSGRRSLRSGTERRGAVSRRRAQDESSDFEPNAEGEGDDDLSDSDASQASPSKQGLQDQDGGESNTSRIRRSRRTQADDELSIDADANADELAEELNDLKATRSRSRREVQPEIIYEEKPRRRNLKSVDYRIIRPDLVIPTEEAEAEVESSSRRTRTGGGAGGWQRSLFSTHGPFGGAGGPSPVLGGAVGGVSGGVDSDSSDDEVMQKPRGLGGVSGMTPTTTVPPALGLFPQTHNTDAAQGPAGTPANLGKIKDKQALADADPLGVDQNVDFDSVGGLKGHIEQLKEMVTLPLLYPEIYQQFHIVPPRGVLFHGPPGTGKTLLARALASSVSSGGRKVTFYMRKGADALSKWVGEAERQLRLLFDEARKNQPSIIFFDEIDGLAPVRSSKQEQIHASIVSTLLALMDGMDGRGQVIVIGATNRPDSIDPALRRPGRFDREFYFPLPNTEARRAILDIHTKGWNPPLPNETKEELAKLTKGYGGADLRALCTEAALNAVQRRYPQIYKSNEKLVIDPKQITVIPKDFMLSIKRMVPSSERATSSSATPLPKMVEPLLQGPLHDIASIIGQMIPLKRNLTALEEAEFEDPKPDTTFTREQMQQDFETSRVFRPRLLIHGTPGMGQQYLAAALLHRFEGLHVQSFDLATLLSDSTRSPEATVIQLFQEVKRHRPSVIYIPDVQAWYITLGHAVISTFLGLLRSLAPTDPILLLGVLEGERQEVDQDMLKNFFGFSSRCRFELQIPSRDCRRMFFAPLVKYVQMSPSDFPDPDNKKKRKFEALEIAPPPPPRPEIPLTKAELQQQRKKDRLTLNLLKIRIQPIMDQIKKYKKFRVGVIDEQQIRYLYDEDNPNIVTTDLPIEQRSKATFRPFEKSSDAKGHPGLLETVSGKFYYNLDIVVIEKRLSNGYYKRPSDFLLDIKRLTKDAKTMSDQDRLLKANELQANVEVDIGGIEASDPNFVAECENVYQRELQREKEAIKKAQDIAAAEGKMAPPMTYNIAHGPLDTSSADVSGPVILGQTFNEGGVNTKALPGTPGRQSNDTSLLTNGQTETSLDTEHGIALSNGSNGSFAAGDDVLMSNSDIPSGGQDTQNSSFGPSAQPKPPHSYTAPSQQTRRESGMAELSQKEALTPMEPGSQPGDYTNDASTTQSTSLKKASDRSSAQHATQGSWPSIIALNTDSKVDAPDLSAYPAAQAVEGVPDTQQDHSYPQSQDNLQQSPPLGHQSNLQSQSNVPDNSSPPALIMDRTWVTSLHNQLVDRTSGCSVEQLEQINTSLMECVWVHRNDYNRTRVGDEIRIAFDRSLADMQAMQDLGAFSHDTS